MDKHDNNPYLELRNNVLNLSYKDIGVNILDYPVWGVLFETTYQSCSFSLIALADGTTSIYFSSGGGIIGAGSHDNVFKSSKNLLIKAFNFIEVLETVNNYPLPNVEYVRFYFLTEEGIKSIELLEDDLGQGIHQLSELFYLSHNVITAVRETKLVD